MASLPRNAPMKFYAMKDGKDVPSLRIGFRYVRGMRQSAAEKLVSERQEHPFEGIEDLIRRVPELQKPELVTLSEIGALNSLGKEMHRRSALWQVERAARPAGPLLDAIPEQMELFPLLQMTDDEGLVANFHGSGLSTRPHPMSYCREAYRSKTSNARRICPEFRTDNTRASRNASLLASVRERPKDSCF